MAVTIIENKSSVETCNSVAMPNNNIVYYYCDIPNSTINTQGHFPEAPAHFPVSACEIDFCALTCMPSDFIG